MAERKRLRDFNEFIIKKHKINLSKPVKLTNGKKHVISCNEDYSAYLTYR